MVRGKRTTKTKHEIFKELFDILDIEWKEKYVSSGATVAADGLEALLNEISFSFGIPQVGLGKEDEKKIRLIHKSQESFILALEMINKTTIPYRIETFCTLFINSWELLLKAKMIQDKKNIYIKNELTKTKQFKDCVKENFKGNNPIRKNLIIIANLRNEAAHLFIRMVPPSFIPIFQAGIINYKNKLLEWFDQDIRKRMNGNSLILIVEEENKSEFVVKYRKKLSSESINYIIKWDKIIEGMTKNLPKDLVGMLFLPIEVRLSDYLIPSKNKIKSYLGKF